MADGKVKTYFKNLKEMMREGVNVPKPKKKDVDGKTNYGINWNKKTKVPKTRPADEIRTGGAQGGIGLTTLPTGTEQTTKTKQGKKPKKKDYLTGIKQPPLEAKHAGKVNLDNVEKVQTNVVEDYDKQARAYGKPPTEKTTEAKKQGERIGKFGHKLDTPHELPRVRGGKKKYSYHLKTPAPASPSPVSVYNNKQRGKIAKDVYGHYDDVSKLKEMTDKDIGHLVKKYQVNLKTEKKSKKNNKKRGR